MAERAFVSTPEEDVVREAECMRVLLWCTQMCVQMCGYLLTGPVCAYVLASLCAQVPVYACDFVCA